MISVFVLVVILVEKKLSRIVKVEYKNRICFIYSC